MHRAHAAQLFAAAGAARAAVLEAAAAGEPWPVDSDRRLAVEHQQAAVPARRSAAPRRARSAGRCVTSVPTRLPRPRAASAIASSSVVVRHQRADRAERFDVVRGVVRAASLASSSVGAKNAPSAHADRRCGVEAVARAEYTTSAPRAARPRARPRLSAARARPARPCARLRSPGRRPRSSASRVAQLLGHGIEMLARHDGAADRGALLAGLRPSSRAPPP